MPVPLPPEEVERRIAVLGASTDTGELIAAGVSLAQTGERTATLALARALRSEAFLLHLDPPTEGDAASVQNVGLIFAALRENPSEWSGRLCELMYGEAGFRAVLSRVNLLLGALAAVEPVTESGAGVFRAAIGEGFAEVLAPLLLRNASPLALTVFEEMLRGGAVSDEVKIDILHRSVLPRRGDRRVLECVARLVRNGLSDAVRVAAVETVFDYQSRLWFGPAMHPPLPPAWEDSETRALEFLIAFAKATSTLPLAADVLAAVAATQSEAEAILAGRQA